jgi:hypothetical protein
VKPFFSAVRVGRTEMLDDRLMDAARRLARSILDLEDDTPPRAGRPGAWRYREQRCRHGFVAPLCEVCHLQKNPCKPRRKAGITCRDRVLLTVDAHYTECGVWPLRVELMTRLGPTHGQIVSSVLFRKRLELTPDNRLALTESGRERLAEIREGM